MKVVTGNIKDLINWGRKEENMSTDVIIAALELAAKHGIPLVMKAIEAMGKDEITLADIQALKITKDPEEF